MKTVAKVVFLWAGATCVLAAGPEIYGPLGTPPIGLGMESATLPGPDTAAIIQEQVQRGVPVRTSSPTSAQAKLKSVEILAEAKNVSTLFGLAEDAPDGRGGDECYAGNGEAYPAPVDGECPSGSRRKQNQGYVWGLTQVKIPGSEENEGHRVWFGTIANPLCQTKAFALNNDSAFPEQYLAEPFPLALTETPASEPGPLPSCAVLGADDFWSCPNIETIERVCEFGLGQLVGQPGIDDATGDWRQPRVYELNRDTGELTDYTPEGSLAAAEVSRIIGVRACFRTPDHKIVFCGGPTLEGTDMLLLAFDTTGDGSRFIGSKLFRGYSNIRKGYAYGDPEALYVGASNRTGTSGRVLRWTGSSDPIPWDFLRLRKVFQFTEVGNTDGLPREFTLIGPTSEGLYRIAVSTTRATFTAGDASGVWVSPLFDGDGLDESDASQWQKVFDFGQYEPDPVTLSITGGGGIVAFNQDGHLYWSSLHVFGYAATVHTNCPFSFCAGADYAAANSQKLAAVVNRAATFWRAPIQADLSVDPATVEMLCGEPSLPSWDNQVNDFVNTPTGWTPSYTRPGGPCGQGFSIAGGVDVNNEEGFIYEYFTAYSWAADINNPDNPADQRMCFGTLDLGGGVFGPVSRLLWGGDLYCAAPNSNTFYPADINGAGNGLNYGYRIIRPDAADPTGKRFLVGMANPFNLELLQREPRQGTPWPNNVPETGWRTGWNVRALEVELE